MNNLDLRTIFNTRSLKITEKLFGQPTWCRHIAKCLEFITSNVMGFLEEGSNTVSQSQPQFFYRYCRLSHLQLVWEECNSNFVKPCASVYLKLLWWVLTRIQCVLLIKKKPFLKTLRLWPLQFILLHYWVHLSILI